MQYGSLFSGIGGFDLALERAGFTCAWQCEIDKACQSVLKKHFNARIYDDVRAISRDNAEPVDLICGGFPCQDLSVAGKRAGLAGERSGLWFEFARIIEEFSPGWVLIENVPGLLSSNGGRDFAIILDQLVKFGYGVAWRVLDAQYFGVAQRRRRVFIVGSLGSGRAAEVLFERESGPGDTPPSREAGEGTAYDVAPVLSASGRGTERTGESRGQDCLIPITATLRGFGHGWQGQHNDTNAVMVASETGQGYWMPGIGAIRAEGENRPSRPSTIVAFGGNNTSGEIDIATAVNAAPTRRYDFESETFVAYNIQHNDGGEHKRKDRPNGGLYVNETDTALTVGTTDLTVISEIHGGSVRKDRPNGGFYLRETETTKPLDTSGLNPACNQGGMMVGVRRLTPTECERLQGFPDGWTAGQSDGARYRQLGNAVAVPVVEWIVRRIADAR